MATLVSTGQITIVDNNDARPITAFIAASGPVQQIFSKDESTTSYTPDWASTPLVLTPKVYVGGTTTASEVTASLTNKKWSTDLSTSLGSGNTFTINTNLATSTPVTYYFEGDYTDPLTGLVSHVIAQIVLSQVKTGTNAVFIQVTGGNVIQESNTATKNTVTLTADLIRASGVDNTGVQYRWFESPFAAANQIDGNLANVTTKYGFRDNGAILAARAGVIGQYLTGGSTSAAISTTNFPNDGWTDAKSITLNELAVTDIAVFKVEARDADGVVYQQFFTVYDVSDPYDTKLVSSAGDKLQNGIGSTDIFPRVYNGATRVTALTGWTFDWSFYDSTGAKAAFVDTTRTAAAGGRNITANTAGAAAVITYSGAAITFANNDIVKLVTPAGIAEYFEVASGTGNTVTLRVPATTQTFLSWAAPLASEFVGGKLFVCTANGVRTTNGGNAELDAKITVTGDEIDAKGTIFCAANRP